MQFLTVSQQRHSIDENLTIEQHNGASECFLDTKAVVKTIQRSKLLKPQY